MSILMKKTMIKMTTALAGDVFAWSDRI